MDTTDTSWRFEGAGEDFKNLCLAYLGAASEAELAEKEMYWILPHGKHCEELWEIPPAINIELEFKDVGRPAAYDENGLLEDAGFSIGYVAFCTYKGRKVILECNASPYCIHWKKSDFPEVFESDTSTDPLKEADQLSYEERCKQYHIYEERAHTLQHLVNIVGKAVNNLPISKVTSDGILCMSVSSYNALLDTLDEFVTE
ncbi:MAG: hypothetical protein OEX12_00250 [Gammaproteobacteria bacterium]|nr:hypothetical protein [Gammaproteobacteria bacterium]